MIRINYIEPIGLLENGTSVLNEVMNALPSEGVNIDCDTDGLCISLDMDCYLTEGAIVFDICNALPYDGISVNVVN